MNARSIALVLFLLAGTGRHASAQRTFIVDALSRPGFQFTAIQPAVDAAAPGDAILVRGGATYTAASVNKGIALLGESEIVLTTGLAIVGLPAGQRVSVKNFRMNDASSNPFGARVVRCSGCHGTLHLERVRGGGSVHGPGLAVNDCAHVSALDCTFDAAASYAVFVPITVFAGANVGVSATRSSLTLVRCRALGFACIGPPNRPGFHGSWSGITATGSRLVLAESVVSGGPGACQAAGTFCLTMGLPTPGLVARSGSTLVLRNTQITGGDFTLGTCSELEEPAIPSILTPHAAAK